MKQYHDLLRHILDKGVDRGDRTGTGTRGVFGYQMRVDLREGFPLLTTKKMFTKAIIVELLWFLQGRTDNQWLKERGVSIWDEWATAEQCAKYGRREGDLGPVYGHQWRNFGKREEQGEIIDDVFVGDLGYAGFDQISWVIEEIKRNPNSRRLIVTGWNPVEASQVALPPCHTLFQFSVRDEVIPSLVEGPTARTATVRRLDCQLYQRSADSFLGVPFNIASYALLTHMVAHVTGLEVGDFIHTFGDLHIYKNHFDQVSLLLSRTPKPLPKLQIKNARTSIFDFQLEDFEFVGYDPHPAIKAPVAV